MAIDDRSWQAAPPGEAAAAEPASRQTARPGAAAKGRYLFFGHVLDTLSRGAAFRGYFARFLSVSAGVIAFAGVVGLLDAWQFTSRQQASGIIGGFAYMFLLAAGIYMVVHAMVSGPAMIGREPSIFSSGPAPSPALRAPRPPSPMRPIARRSSRRETAPKAGAPQPRRSTQEASA